MLPALPVSNVPNDLDQISKIGLWFLNGFQVQKRCSCLQPKICYWNVWIVLEVRD